MAEHIWTVLCGKHLVDPDNQVISLQDVLESIEQEGLEQRLEEARRLGKPGTLVNAPMQLVSWWHRSDPKEESLQMRVVLLDPAGESMMVSEVNLPWGEEAPTPTTRRIFVKIDLVPVTMLGVYWFVVEQPKATKGKAPRWISATRIPLGVGVDML